MSVVSPAEKEGVAVTAVQLRRRHRARQRRDRIVGSALLRQAAEAEDKMPFDYGPPLPAKPSRELLGEALLKRAVRRSRRGVSSRAQASAGAAVVAPRVGTGGGGSR